MAKLEDILMDAERLGLRIELIDKVDELYTNMPSYTPLEEVYELAVEAIRMEYLTKDL